MFTLRVSIFRESLLFGATVSRRGINSFAGAFLTFKSILTSKSYRLAIVRGSRAVLRNTPSRRAPRGNPLITFTIPGRRGCHGTNLREREQLSRLPSRTSVRARAQERAGEREKNEERKRGHDGTRRWKE